MTTVIERPWRQQTRSRFFFGMAVAATVTVLIGFAPTFYLRGYLPMRPDQPALTPILFIHGVLGTAWIALFLAQSLLIVSHRVALHKRLGVAGGVLAALVVGVGMMTAVDALRRNVGPFGIDPRTWFLSVPLAGTALFGSLVGTALVRRRSPDTHKRLMLLATITLLNPALGRIVASYLGVGLVGFLVLIFVLTDFFVIAAAWYDLRVRGRIHPALARGGLAVIIIQPIVLALGATSPLLALADRFR
jgi:uncharacterized membrane protein YozB (DUF420 family)